MKKRIILLFAIGITYFADASGWIQKADFGGVARHRMPMLAIGNKIYTGLGHYNGGGINVLFDDWWEYDPATNAWTQKADYMGGICYHPAGFAIGNYGYVGTGRIHPSSNTLTANFYRYDPATNSWVQKASLPGLARRGAVGFELGGYGYLGTGETTSGNTATFYRYNPSTDSWIQIADFTGGARNSAVAFSIGIYAYVGTGNTNTGSKKDFWRYNTALNAWEQKADVGTTNRQEACGFSLNGKGYIGTGDDYSSGNNFGDMWEYDVALNAWTQIEDFEGTARRYLTAATLNGLAYAGLGTNGTNFKDFWIFDQTLSLLERKLENMEVKTYPNPATNYINVELNGLSNDLQSSLEIDLYNLNGSKLSTLQVEEVNTKIQLNQFTQGRYLISLRYKNHHLRTTHFNLQ